MVGENKDDLDMIFLYLIHFKMLLRGNALKRQRTPLFVVAPTKDFFRDAIKEQYYPVGSYDDL
jgi:hypothetical protein